MHLRINAPFVGKGSILHRTAEQERELKKKYSQENHWSLQLLCWIHPHWLQGINQVCTPAFTQISRNIIPADKSTWHISTPASSRTKTPKLGHGKGCNCITSTMLHEIPPCKYCLHTPHWQIWMEILSYPTPGLTTSIPISAPGMYNYTHNTGTNIPAGAQSTTSNASLESHVTA